MRDLRTRLEDILEAITKIETEQAKGRGEFESNHLVQVWMVHHLMIIGEPFGPSTQVFASGIHLCLGGKSQECGTSLCTITFG